MTYNILYYTLGMEGHPKYYNKELASSDGVRAPFGITNNSGAPQVVYYSYTKL